MDGARHCGRVATNPMSETFVLLALANVVVWLVVLFVWFA